jgi:hypothetical protein
MTVEFASIRPILEKCVRIHYLKQNKPRHEVIRFCPKPGLRLTEKEINLLIAFLHKHLPSVQSGEITACEIADTKHIAMNINDVEESEINALKEFIPETKPTN